MCADKTKTDGAHLKAALAYRRCGWSVIPAGERAKRPIIRWQRFQHQLPTVEELEHWYERWPNANLAVVTGEISGIVVVDIDPRHGGAASLGDLEARHGALPETVESVTGGSGRHLYFAYPGRDVRNRAGLAPGIDLRGDGGCIIVPPSVHPSGKRYEWRPGHAPGELALATLPIWLEQPRFGSDGPRGHALDYWREIAREGVRDGQRNSTIASFTGHLLWHDVDPDVIMELMLAWNRVRCRPPLEDEEVIRTVQSIERTHKRYRED